MRKSARILAVYLICAAAIQLAFGDFPVAAFAFPVNAAFLFAGLAGLWVLHRETPGSRLSAWLSSGSTSILLIAALFVSCLVMGIVPQDNGESGFLGLKHIVHTWWFVAIAVALVANLAMVILTRRQDLRFCLNHIGILLALVGGFFGAPDTEVLRSAVYRDTPSREAFNSDGSSQMLGYELSMLDFTIEEDENGGVRNYDADILVDNEEARIRVNSPCRRTIFEDIYLVSYDRASESPRYCVLEIVRQPWKYVIWAGVVMMMAGAVLMFAKGSRKKEVDV
ncbi:MAG: cytochrome c biogenesis protein ResB [Candidatus Cryptobacteroides sp.]